MTDKDHLNICTSTSQLPKPITLDAIQDAIKLIMAIPDTRKIDKDLGIKAADIKFSHPEDYRKMSDEDKCLIENAIEKAAYIVRQERQEAILKIKEL